MRQASRAGNSAHTWLAVGGRPARGIGRCGPGADAHHSDGRRADVRRPAQVSPGTASRAQGVCGCARRQHARMPGHCPLAHTKARVSAHTHSPSSFPLSLIMLPSPASFSRTRAGGVWLRGVPGLRPDGERLRRRRPAHALPRPRRSPRPRPFPACPTRPTPRDAGGKGRMGVGGCGRVCGGVMCGGIVFLKCCAS